MISSVNVRSEPINSVLLKKLFVTHSPRLAPADVSPESKLNIRPRFDNGQLSPVTSPPQQQPDESHLVVRNHPKFTSSQYTKIERDRRGNN